MKRIFALVLCALLVLGMAPATQAHRHEPIEPRSVDRCCELLRTDISPNAMRPDFGGKLIEITPQRVTDTFDYLNEVYIQDYPEAALILDVADETDRAAIQALAEEITAGCRTDRQKADAIDQWMLENNGNITYEVNASAYANDTYYNRVGNCLSYANLMQAMLRSLGIPAVMGDGWRGDMKAMGVELFNYVGHAWCFAYVGGEWRLYDPLWIEGGTTDRTYIAEWIYLDQVEVVTPASDEDNLPPETYDRFKVYYTDGRWYMYSNALPNGSGVFTSYLNNQMFAFVGCQDEGGIYDGWYYLDGRSKADMKVGQVYRNGWVSYGGYHPVYAHVNGMMIDGAVMNYDGRDMFMSGNQAFPILAAPRDYSIQYGLMSFKPGYTGKFLEPAWGDAYKSDTWGTYIGTWTSQNPEVVSVTTDGIITCHTEGYATLQAQLIREEDNAFMSTQLITIYVSDVERNPGIPEHSHSYTVAEAVPATCTEGGHTTYTCSCGDSYTETIPALGHDYVGYVTEPTCTEGGYTTMICTHCGGFYSTNPTDPLGHLWDEGQVVKEPSMEESGEILYTCMLCGETRTTYVEPHHHDYVVTAVVAPTCTGDGYSVFTCKGCWHHYNDAFIDALGHEWEGETCTRCGQLREIPFTDVPSGSWYAEPVLWAMDNDITNGMGDGSFGSERDCNRAQVVTFLWRAMGCPEPTLTENPFSDVPAGSWYEKPVLWAVENGVTNGMGDGTFGVDTYCNRAQVVTFLWRALDCPTPAAAESDFTDVPAGQWYTAPVLWAVENGITNGMGDGTFGVNRICNRAQVVTFLWRACGE